MQNSSPTTDTKLHPSMPPHCCDMMNNDGTRSCATCGEMGPNDASLRNVVAPSCWTNVRNQRKNHHRHQSHRRPFATSASFLIGSLMMSLVLVNSTLLVSAFTPPIGRRQKFYSSFSVSGKNHATQTISIRYHQLLLRCVENIRDPARATAQDSVAPNGTLESSTTATVDLPVSVDDKDENRNNSSTGSLSEETLGLVILATVPIVWGSYVPVVRGLYEIDPPIPGFVFSTAYFFVASVSMLSLLTFRHTKQQQQSDQPVPSHSSGESSSNENTTTVHPKVAANSGEKTSSWKNSILAGAELGSYLFLGNSLQVLGLKTVPSDRAGFLVQLTTILVPLVQTALSGGFLTSVSLQTWVACILALAGITIMGYDGADLDLSLMSLATSNSPALTTGDCLILGAAFVYSLHVVRLGRWANETEPLQLVAYKATTELILSLILIAVLAGVAADASTNNGIDASTTAVTATNSNLLVDFCRDSGQEIVTFFETLQGRMQSQTLSVAVIQKAVGATLWTGLVSTAYTTYAQSYGQRRVKPADANLIYSMQPIFTALFAYVLLGETMGPFGFGGGALIGGAVYLAASQSFSLSLEEKKSDGV